MFFLNKILAVVVLCAAPVLLQARNIYFSAAGCTIAIADSATAARETLRPDEYTAAHTPFDLAIRLDKAKGLTEKNYLQAAASNVQNWPATEEQEIRDAFAGIDAFIKARNIRLKLPDTVIMIKTTGKEEFGAEGWTRKNRIMLNTGAQPISLHLVAHELFHVLSRHSEQTRNAAYAIFHFKPCNNISYKPALQNQVITNPDCPFIMHYITLNINEQPQDATLILYSKKAYYAGYNMGDYANIGLLALTGDDQHKQPLLKDGKPVIYELSDVPDLFTHIGMNTQYLLHVEEISAEHFAALVGNEKVKQQEYVDAMANALAN